MGLTITQQQADQWLEHDLEMFARGLSGLVRVPLSDNQWSALLSLTYNIGLRALAQSTLLRWLNAGDYTKAGEEFARWVYDGGQRIEGLVKRRAAEAELWFTTP
jgi:lysozyme